jgi:hypothetical protein
MNANSVTISTVYTFAMAKVVSIQIRGVEKAVRIEADKVDRQNAKDINGAPILDSYRLLLSKEGTQVGEFNSSIVDGWWYED